MGKHSFTPARKVVRGADGQSLAYVYWREPKAVADIAKVLTWDEVRPAVRRAISMRSLLAYRTAPTGLALEPPGRRTTSSTASS